MTNTKTIQGDKFIASSCSSNLLGRTKKSPAFSVCIITVHPYPIPRFPLSIYPSNLLSTSSQPPLNLLSTSSQPPLSLPSTSPQPPLNLPSPTINPLNLLSTSSQSPTNLLLSTPSQSPLNLLSISSLSPLYLSSLSIPLLVRIRNPAAVFFFVMICNTVLPSISRASTCAFAESSSWRKVKKRDRRGRGEGERRGDGRT
jgi:hypothetical protein